MCADVGCLRAGAAANAPAAAAPSTSVACAAFAGSMFTAAHAPAPVLSP